MSSLARLFSLRSFDHRSIFTVCLRLCPVFLYGTAGSAFQFNTGVNSGFRLIIQPISSCAAQDRAAVFPHCAILDSIGADSRRSACCSGAHIAKACKNSFISALLCGIASLQAQSRKMAGCKRPDDDNCIIFHRFANKSASRPSPSCTPYSSCAAALLKKFKH
jgi:hypothetical protein